MNRFIMSDLMDNVIGGIIVFHIALLLILEVALFVEYLT
jgi:hypothetical protein